MHSTTLLPFQKILCPIDFSGTSYEALRRAGELAHATESQLLLLHVVPFPIPNAAGFRSEEEARRFTCKEADSRLHKLVLQHLGQVKQTEVMVRSGSPAGVVIADTARAESAGLIVMGTHGETGWRRLILGSVTAEVIRSTSCPVLTVNLAQEGREAKNFHAEGRSKKILCPIDFSAPSLVGLEKAGELAVTWGADLYLLHAMNLPASLTVVAIGADTDSAGSDAAQALLPVIEKHLPEQVQEKARFNRLVRVGKPAKEITQAAEEYNIDLIVMATHGQTGWRRWVFGSVTEAVLCSAPCPVLSIHPPQATEYENNPAATPSSQAP